MILRRDIIIVSVKEIWKLLRWWIQQPVQYNLREQHIDFEEIVKAHVNHFEKHKKMYEKTTHETDNGVIVHRYMDKDGLVKAEILEKSKGKTLVVEVYSIYKDTLLYIDPRGSFFVSAPDSMMVLDRELKDLDLKNEEVKERIYNVLSRLEKLNII